MQIYSYRVNCPSDVSHMAYLQGVLAELFTICCSSVSVYTYVSFPRRNMIRPEVLHCPFDLGLLED